MAFDNIVYTSASSGTKGTVYFGGVNYIPGGVPYNPQPTVIFQPLPYPVYQPFPGLPPFPNPYPKAEQEKMRGLYEVVVVDPEIDDIVGTEMVIASDEARARMKAVVSFGDALKKDLDEYDVLVRLIGSVRAKKSVQEVRVVKE